MKLLMMMISDRMLLSILNYFPVAMLLLWNLPGLSNGEAQLLATPKDAIVNVGSNTNLTCIVAETCDKTIMELQWIISWDTTASVQVIPADITQEITGYHYGKNAERGEYVVEYESKLLGSSGSDCTHVVHITVLHIKNTTLRDAGTFACGSEGQKAKVTVIETLSKENDLAGCDLITVVIGLTCVVGWCLAVVEFSVLICTCLKKPKHAARRRRIKRNVSVLLPQSRRANYDVRMKKRSAAANNGYEDDDMVQHVPRMIEIEPEEKENMSPEEKQQFYMNITDNAKSNIHEDEGFPKRVPLVTFSSGLEPSSSSASPSSLPGNNKKRDRKYRPKKKNVSPKKRPDTLAVVKPFGLKESQRSNPIFDDGDTDGDVYVNLPSPTETKTPPDDFVNDVEEDEMVSTPL